MNGFLSKLMHMRITCSRLKRGYLIVCCSFIFCFCVHYAADAGAVPSPEQCRRADQVSLSGFLVFRQMVGINQIETTTNRFSYQRLGDSYKIEIEFVPDAGSEQTWRTREGVLCLGDFPVVRLSKNGNPETLRPGRDTPLSVRVHRLCFPWNSSYGAKVVWYAFSRVDLLRSCGKRGSLELPWDAPGQFGSRAFEVSVDESPERTLVQFLFSKEHWPNSAKRLQKTTPPPHFDNGLRLGWLGKPVEEQSGSPADLMLVREDASSKGLGQVVEAVLINVSHASDQVDPGSLIPPLSFSKPANVIDYRMATDEQPFLNVQYGLSNGPLPGLDSQQLRLAFARASTNYDRKMKALARPGANPDARPDSRSRGLVAVLFILSTTAFAIVLYKLLPAKPKKQ